MMAGVHRPPKELRTWAKAVDEPLDITHASGGPAALLLICRKRSEGAVRVWCVHGTQAKTRPGPRPPACMRIEDGGPLVARGCCSGRLLGTGHTHSSIWPAHQEFQGVLGSVLLAC